MLTAPPTTAEDDGQAVGLLPQLLLALVCAGYTTGATLGWGRHEIALVMGDFGLAAAAAAASVSSLLYARRAAGPHRPAWLLFSCSSAMTALGNGIWGWYEVVLRRPVPQTSAADFCFLMFAPPAIIGLLVLAKRPVTRAGWVCLALDTWLIGGSLLTLSWSLALARTATIDGPSTARMALSLAYPLLDIVLVSMVLALHFRRAGVNRAAVNTAIAALALTVLCDALFTSPLLREHYRSGQVLDAGWFAGSLLLAYAPWVGARMSASPHPHPPRRAGAATRKVATSLTALTPYLAAAVCTLGILYNVINGQKCDRVVLLTGCTVVMALVVRQGIMLLDNIALTQELAQKENHFRSLVQGSSDVIMIAAPTGVLRYVSPAAQGVYGRDPEEMVGTELAAHIHPDDLGRVLHEVRRFLAAPPGDEPSTRIECRIRADRIERPDRPDRPDRPGVRHGWLDIESSVTRYQGGLIFNSRDITERVRLQAQLQHNASHDPLTDLPNRALFLERLGRAVGGRRAGDARTAVLYVDLDGFKAVNDTVGHQAGDDLLVQAARRLRATLRSSDVAARLGGDEFAALISGPEGATAASPAPYPAHPHPGHPGHPADRFVFGAHGPIPAPRTATADPPKPGPRPTVEERIRDIADRLRTALSEPYRVDGIEVRVGASIGIAFAEPGAAPGEVMRHADLAMYRAKQSGKGRVELYAPRLQAEAVRRTELAGRVRTALDNGDFTLLHQPVVELSGGRITGVEARARWRTPQGILFTPAEFLYPGDGAERDLETARLFDHLLDQAVEQAALRYGAGHRVPVTVRLSARRLLHRDPPATGIEHLLARHELPPSGLVVELAGDDPRIAPEELERRLTCLRRLGVRIALGGFAAGYGSLGALRTLPVDVIKLDRAFTDGVVESTRLHKITRGLLGIAADLGIRTVADGIDRPEQVQALREMGCAHGVGMAFSGPLDEHHLRGSLTRGGYPVCSNAETPVPPA
ncbi:PAS domain S-box-containing protein/diguanylate cyclase (GGDEF) domain-containing protein [Actinacidiphila yanglinensis]|uniref:PAS domain S-box-containing protein/diguanylate cyclase (GGDEF) domain-containing protein n=1 Tax=Actinacidiphila yanglinensis TaxID=310779 RepID=A0A1H5WBR6_9ACTN|nr:EAL domain-containing protein [Actinacidiphila yanglinensis]SEF96912.1 PAS domain S-box-containing protein/diguanylate cyclase (GGDEF) domain-containing protein [Actinacidiphila yanglinensis]